MIVSILEGRPLPIYGDGQNVCDWLFVADRPGHDRRYAIDSGKIERQRGFVPGVSLEDGLAATFRWCLEHEPWWRLVIDGRFRSWIAQQYASTI